MFRGDTFGLAYPELASARGAFVMPTTTPVQFEPEALVASIDRLVSHSPQAMLLTHYSRVTEIERLASDLRRQIGELTALGRAAADKPDRAARLRAGMRELVLGWIHDHGTALATDAILELVSLDVELNAQGLEAWLDRDTRG